MSTNSTPERRARMATTGRFVKPQEPMTQEQLDAIRGRVDSVEFPDNEYLTVVHGKENLVSWVERSRLDGSVVSGAVVATVHAGPQSAELFAHAPQDITDLLAEVERLQNELSNRNFSREDFERYTDEMAYARQSVGRWR